MFAIFKKESYLVANVRYFDMKVLLKIEISWIIKDMVLFLECYIKYEANCAWR